MTTPLAVVPANPVGKFIAVFEAQKPRTLLHVERVIYEITGTKGAKQVLLRTAFVPEGGSDKPRAYTVLGDNVAAILDSLDAGKLLLSEIEKLTAAYEAAEALAYKTVSEAAFPVVTAPAAAPVRARSRTATAPTSSEETPSAGPVTPARVRTRQPVPAAPASTTV